MKNVPLQNATARTLPPPEAVRDALDRLCASGPFRNSNQLTAFLRYVVEAVLNDEADKIKAYTIAVDALRRPENFDPISDAIVRVEAGRLRRTLTQYYDNEGELEPITLGMQPGSYVPTIAWRTGAVVPFAWHKPTNSNNVTHLAYCTAVLADGHSTLVRHQYLFARCHRNMAAVSRGKVELRGHIEDARALVIRSRELVERSRNRRAQRILTGAEAVSSPALPRKRH